MSTFSGENYLFNLSTIWTFFNGFDFWFSHKVLKKYELQI